MDLESDLQMILILTPEHFSYYVSLKLSVVLLLTKLPFLLGEGCTVSSYICDLGSVCFCGAS